jgi:hypothetical protein
MDGTCSTNETAEWCIQILVERPKGKRLFGRHSHRFVDNIKIYRKEITCKNMDWIQLAQDRLR